MATATTAQKRAQAKAEYDAFLAQCPSRKLLDRISDKWVVLVLAALGNDGSDQSGADCAGPARSMRYSELARLLAGVSQKMLTQTLRSLERDGLLTTDLTQVAQAQSRPLAGLKRCGALKVGQREIAFAITTVRRSQKRKQCCVLVNGKHLAVAKRPPLRGEVTRKNPNFGNELVGHGLEWVWSVDTGEDALERDDKIEREVRRHILVRLVAAHSGDRTRAEVSVGLSGQSIRIRAAGRPNMVGGQALIGGGRAAHRKMAVDGKFGNAEGMTRLPAKLAQGETAAKMHRNAPLEIREAKGDPAIAAVIGSEEGKERLVLINGQQLPITKCPSFRGEIKRDNADFRQER